VSRSSPQQIRFGEFELDLQTAELRANGRTLILQGQPFQVLAILLERPGHLVTREELKKRLWPREGFGDFDHGLNKAINRLRETLQDSAEHPRFIETLPKRGYRFVASQVSGADNAVGTRPAYLAHWKMLAILGLLVTVAGAWRLRSNGEPAFESVAVVPFVNLSGDPKIEYLTDGISEGLIGRLSQIPSLTVRPPTAGLRYKGKKTDPQTVAKELRVQAVVVGHVNQQADSLIVSAELVDGVNNRTLWGETYYRKLSGVIEVERDISLEICDRLHQRLSRQQQAKVGTSATINPEAYESYLKGRFYWEKRTPDALQLARDYFNQAIAADPKFVQAYVGLADYWAVAPDF
jgi:TolB-like protein/DNA-binding winged helix-turn-helix (wHTH) protein